MHFYRKDTHRETFKLGSTVYVRPEMEASFTVQVGEAMGTGPRLIRSVKELSWVCTCNGQYTDRHVSWCDQGRRLAARHPQEMLLEGSSRILSGRYFTNFNPAIQVGRDVTVTGSGLRRRVVAIHYEEREVSLFGLGRVSLDQIQP
jgi:hypothetical protein